MIVLRSGEATDIGLVRSTNQDRLLVKDNLFAVADGMGGHAGGEEAASVAISSLGESSLHTTEELVEAVQKANGAVFQKAIDEPSLAGMGTTLVAMLLDPNEGTLTVINVGDSRLYRLRNNEFEQLTVDHSLVAELVAEGRLSEEDAESHPKRNVLTRVLGVDSEVEVDVAGIAVDNGDRFLLCSDGLSKEVPDSQVASVLRRLADPQEAAQELIVEARSRGGKDNITVVVVDVVDDTQPPIKSGPDTSATPAVTDDGESKKHHTKEKRRRILTLRFLAFFFALLVILGAAIGAVTWYARDTYYVGLQGKQIVIFQGQPGGLLWFKPTVAEKTGVLSSQVEKRHLNQLNSGEPETSLSAARQYVANLVLEYKRATTSTTTTTTSTTTTTTT